MGDADHAQPPPAPVAADERGATPASGSAAADQRAVNAWCAWLDALATAAEAALAAAMAYKELDAASRENWLEALAQDAQRVGVPRVAMYAPLLAVETDAARRERIAAAMGKVDPSAAPAAPACGLRGTGQEGLVVVAGVSPLYLDFVQVLACGVRTGSGFEWVRHDPIVDRRRAPRERAVIEGVSLEARPLSGIIDELASAILAHRRAGKALPDALRLFADLFSPSATAPSPAAP